MSGHRQTRYSPDDVRRTLASVSSVAGAGKEPRKFGPGPSRIARRLGSRGCPQRQFGPRLKLPVTLMISKSLFSVRKFATAAVWGRMCLETIAVYLVLVCVGCGGRPSSGQASTDEQNSLERTSTKGPVKLVVRASPREPRLSDLMELQIQVSAPIGVEFKPPTFGQAVGEFVIRDYTERTDGKERTDVKDQAKSSATNHVRTFVYQLEPMHAGRHLIRSLAIEFVDTRPTSEQKDVKAFIESDPLEINVTSELGDQVPNLADLEPMLPPRPLPSTSRWGWILLAGAMCGVGGLFYWLRRRKQIEIAETTPLTAEQIAHAALEQLLAENLPEKQLYKEFYLRLTGIVRHYIEGSTGIRAPELTTEEFLSAMRSRDLFSAERSVRLKEFLEAADMVKYAGQEPNLDQIELSIARAHEFVAYHQPIVSTNPADAESTSPESVAIAGGQQ